MMKIIKWICIGVLLGGITMNLIELIQFSIGEYYPPKKMIVLWIINSILFYVFAAFNLSVLFGGKRKWAKN